MGAKCEKQKLYSGIFRIIFFAFCTSFSRFPFRSISRKGRQSREKSKDFVVYFFATLIKHEIGMKCDKCIMSVSHFVVCFV